jgi:hypothetical protein
MKTRKKLITHDSMPWCKNEKDIIMNRFSKKSLRRYIDRAIRKEICRQILLDSLYRDYGVKGMKKGVRHEDPTTGDQRRGSGSNKPMSKGNGKNWKHTAAKIGIGAAAIGAGVGLGLLAHKALNGKRPTSSVTALKPSSIRPSAISKPKPSPSSHGTALVPTKSSSSSHSSQSEKYDLTNIEHVKKALSDPNYVFNI